MNYCIFLKKLKIKVNEFKRNRVSESL